MEKGMSFKRQRWGSRKEKEGERRSASSRRREDSHGDLQVEAKNGGGGPEVLELGEQSTKGEIEWDEASGEPGVTFSRREHGAGWSSFGAATRRVSGSRLAAGGGASMYAEQGPCFFCFARQ
jgi:hypothetical protein